MNLQQYVGLVVRPTLEQFKLWSAEAENLVLGTALHESAGLRFIKQVNGPALGFIQMEPATYKDIWDNFLSSQRNAELKASIYQRFGDYVKNTPEYLITDMALGVLMCRIHYLRARDPIPDTLIEQASYWKKWYNTHLGKGTVEDYLTSWRIYGSR